MLASTLDLLTDRSSSFFLNYTKPISDVLLGINLCNTETLNFFLKLMNMLKMCYCYVLLHSLNIKKWEFTTSKVYNMKPYTEEWE